MFLSAVDLGVSEPLCILPGVSSDSTSNAEGPDECGSRVFITEEVNGVE